MKWRLNYIVLLLSTLLFSGCGALIFKEITCRDFSMTEENFWFANRKADSIYFVSNHNDSLKLYVNDKTITHTTKYISDTGCSCRDWSGMLLTNFTDSIWFTNETNYIYNNEDEGFEKMLILIGGAQSYFDESDKTILSSQTIAGNEYKDIKRFEYKYTDSTQVKYAYLVKNKGLIQFEQVNGTIWTLATINQNDSVSVESFDYSEDSCY